MLDITQQGDIVKQEPRRIMGQVGGSVRMTKVSLRNRDKLEEFRTFMAGVYSRLLSGSAAAPVSSSLTRPRLTLSEAVDAAIGLAHVLTRPGWGLFSHRAIHGRTAEMLQTALRELGWLDAEVRFVAEAGRFEVLERPGVAWREVGGTIGDALEGLPKLPG